MEDYHFRLLANKMSLSCCHLIFLDHQCTFTPLFSCVFSLCTATTTEENEDEEEEEELANKRTRRAKPASATDNNAVGGHHMQMRLGRLALLRTRCRPSCIVHKKLTLQEESY